MQAESHSGRLLQASPKEEAQGLFQVQTPVLMILF
jgi:hypothetical protein